MGVYIYEDDTTLESPWRLRWRFEYSNGRPSRYGIWDYSDAKHALGSAFAQPKDNLLYAIIEAENRDRNRVIHAIVCDGPDYCNFAWEATAYVYSIATSNTQLDTVTNGLTLVSRTHRHTFYRNGNFKIIERTDPDTLYHFGTEGMVGILT